MGAAEVICCFFLEEKIHNRPEISDHFHTHVPERGAQNTHTIQDPLGMVRQGDMSDGKRKCKHARVSYGKSQARGGGGLKWITYVLFRHAMLSYQM